ncbi:SusC/RagA family TonB-linked outer membrane protein [Algoriphagus winogradskyi]|uniref:TonB-linked outer membrane protein, SusC/RagA family n=1 Tax=Algoriphagus winogradskyi TaxID=237017 RepID=A0ABY1NZT9_9BACT|nr:TonB-dependent receptor [Algoriphagus winogradskyi]SMP22959.1 TonB-linked outer membrane protein, SusC/RagA family [Algoriphagus winogradskyi]
MTKLSTPIFLALIFFGFNSEESQAGNNSPLYLQDTVPLRDTIPPPSTQKSTITGIVTDGEGNSLPGTTVLLKGTQTGGISDDSGKYSIEIPADQTNAVLVFSFLGFETKEIVVGNKTIIDVSLSTDDQELDEIVVIGYGSARRADLTGSVAQVNSDELNAFPTSNVIQSLNGRAPGVQVIQNNGAPGGGVSVRIRGANSIQGDNDPLYVIDGFPFSGNPTNLNNSDIASIEILKDASATAIYGSRGANGVVLITTKNGSGAGTVVEFDAAYSMQSLREKLDLMDGSQYAELMNIQATNDGLEPYFTDAEVNSFGEGTDWQDEIFQQAPIKNTSLSISGGGESTQFLVGGSIYQQDGIIKGSDYDRYSIRSTINHKISDKFKVDFNSTLSKLVTARRDSEGGARGASMIGAALVASPLSDPFTAEGTINNLADDFPFVSPDLVNPFYFINEQSTVITANVILANTAISYNPIPEITIKISGGIENRDDRTDNYRSRDFINSNGNASVTTSQYVSRLNENTITYADVFNEKHDLNVLAGFTFQDFTTKYLAGSGAGFLSDLYETDNLGAAETPGIPTSGYANSVLLSYLGRVNYGFDSKYLFTASFRADGSSRYSEGNKWGYFPSGAIAWKVSEEEFMKTQEAISTLKIRSSWGLTGSQAINPYATLNRLFPGYTIFGDELYNFLAPGSTLPGDLKWETTEQFDLGLDLGLWQDRIVVGADYYLKTTDDLLSTVRLPSSFGYTTTIANVGSIENRGVELSLFAQLFSNEFRWSLDGNISFNRNKVLSLNDGQPILTNFINVITVSDNFSIMEEGKPLGQFWGYQEDGYTETGAIKYVDRNNDGEISEEDKTYIGNPNPDFFYGFNSNMSFKGFQLDLFFQGSQGNDIMNVSAISSTMDYGQGLNMPEEVLLDHWTPQNIDAKYPKISRSSTARVSDRFVEDGSYLRLKNVLLAYNFPLKNSSGKFLQSLRIYASGQNLLTFTDYSWWDPEVNSKGSDNTQGIDHFSYPIPKSYTIGLNATF